MPRESKLRYWEERNIYYCQVAGKRHYLGADKKAATQQFHQLMAKPKPAQAVPSTSLAALADRFINWVASNRAPRTAGFYRERLERFIQSLPKSIRASSLTDAHVQDWLDAHPNWSRAYKSGMIQAIKRLYRWAERRKHIDRSPVATLERPGAEARENLLTPEDHALILETAHSEAFRELCRIAWLTGARPREILRVEARHVDLETGRWAFPRLEAKGQKHPRMVYLNEEALRLTKQAMERHPAGPIFRNSNGRPWCTMSCNCAFERSMAEIGIRRMKERGVEPTKTAILAFAGTLRTTCSSYGKEVTKSAKVLFSEARRKLRRKMARDFATKFALYDYRHSWCHRFLTNGGDPVTAAALMGHRDLTMIHRVYGHLMKAPAHLREELKRAVG